MGEIFDYTLRLYQRTFQFLAPPVALLQGPALLFFYFVYGLYQSLMEAVVQDPDLMSPPNPAVLVQTLLDRTGVDLSFLLRMSQADFWGLGGLWLAGVIYMGVAAVLLQVAIINVIGQRILGQPITWRTVWEPVKRFGWRAIAAMVLQSLVLLPAGILLWGSLGAIYAAALASTTGPAPGWILGALFIGFPVMLAGALVVIWLTTALVFVEPALVVEDLGPWAAIKRSLALVRGQWWRVFGVTLVFSLLVEILAAVVVGLAGLVLGLAFPSPAAVLWTSTITQTTMHVFTAPLIIVLQALLYFDLRVRKEQFDLYYLLGAALPQTHPAPVPAPATTPYAPAGTEASLPPGNPYEG